ncbi:MAG: pilus assembly protein CpaE [Anaerolineae bacterium]|nr:pilus assembly protein CpaE [Anaerolineae bacterium]MCB0179177.1 pilus assembly protein CpaE [Anaerolineae bacterium]MCB0222349.1 pilus assembly protein CpaE [Anaerolineae bacterium]MCB9107098.1 pilus assembly protein CpaE [Anaerolineales bacterium]
MLSINLAQQLKVSGLEWQLQKNDFFHIPDRGFDDTVFVVTDMTVLVEKLHGNLAITFHGTVEWALDHVLVTELVWLPSESQLREELEKHLIGETEPSLVLISTADGYRCEIRFKGEFLAFEAFGVSDVYATALLYVLQNK